MHAACSGGCENIAIALLDLGFAISTQLEYDDMFSEIGNAGFAQAMLRLQEPSPSTATLGSPQRLRATANIRSREHALLRRQLKGSALADVIVPGSLALSAMHVDVLITNLLIEKGVNVDEVGDAGTPFRCASAYGHETICRMLLDRGANVNHNGQFGSALHAAAMRGHLSTIGLLIDSRAHVNASGGSYGTPLQAAAYHGHAHCVEVLRHAGAQIDQPGLFHDAMQAAVEGDYPNIVQIFLDADHLPSIPTHLNRVVLAAASYTRPNILRDASPTRKPRPLGYIWQKSSDAANEPRDSLDSITHLNPYQSTDSLNERAERPPYLLEAAAALGHNDVLRTLLTYTGQLTPSGTSLDIALAYREPSIGNTTSNNAQVLERSELHDNSDTLFVALLAACHHGRISTVRELLQMTGQQTRDFRSALHTAIQGGRLEIVQLLPDDTADSTQKADYLQFIMESSLPQNPSIFAHTIKSMKTEFAPSHLRSILLVSLPYVAVTDWVALMHLLLEELASIEANDLVEPFEAALDAGSAGVFQLLYPLMDADVLSAHMSSRRVCLAVQEGHQKLLRLLIPKVKETQSGSMLSVKWRDWASQRC